VDALRSSVAKIEQGIREAVTAAELFGHARDQPLVECLAGALLLGERFGGLRRRWLREHRRVDDRPELQKASEHLRQELEVAVLALA
jgi:hypothetical protein